jgi:MFS family permease
MKRVIRWYHYITYNIYWFALTARSQVLSPLIIPLLIQRFVGEFAKGELLGNMRLWALMAAVLVQALMGLLSDQSTSKFGRRRPFIVAGTFGEIILYIFIGFTAGMEGMAGYWFLFLLYTLSMMTANTAHAATQGIIPDLVPEEKRGRFSGFKALFELPLPLIFVSFVIGKMVSAGNLWGALITLIAVMVVCLLLTLTIKEEPLQQKSAKVDWNPIIRLFIMTAAFTVIILASGFFVRQIMNFILQEDTTYGHLGVMAIGLLGMLIAIGVGVWSSVYISIGQKIQDHQNFTWWVVNRLAFLAGSTNLAGFLVFFLQERFVELQGEKAAGPAASITMFIGIFILISAVPSGWLTDRFGTKKIILVSAILTTLGTALVLLSPSISWMYAAGCLVGAGIGFFYASNWALGTEIVPKDQAGKFLGISNLAGAGAGAVGAYIGGPIADQIGYTNLMVIYVILFLFSILALAKIKTGDKKSINFSS